MTQTGQTPTQAPERPARAVRPRGVERRAAIIDAAAEAVLTAGIGALSHRVVAAAAGVPLGSTTYYFSSLDELKAAAIEKLFVSDRERRAEMLAGGVPADVCADSLALRLVDLVIALPRLTDRTQVALLYERIAEAVRAPLVAEVIQGAQRGIEVDMATLIAGTDWEGADPAALVGVVDGRALGWLAEGVGAPQVLIDRIAADLLCYRPARG